MVQRFRQDFHDTIPKHPLEEANGIILPLFLLFLLPPVLGVCPNHEVVMFQPRTVTHLYLGSVVSCYVATPFFLTRSALIRPLPGFLLRVCLHPPLATLLSTSFLQPHRIIFPPGLPLSPSQNTDTHISLPHILTPLHPCLLCSFHTCSISNADPLPPPKSL